MINRVMLVVDESGSMQGLKDAVVRTTNELYCSWLSTSKDAGQQAEVELLLFNDINRLGTLPLESSGYRTGGYTALFDAVLSAITRLERLSIKGARDTAFVVQVITDGYENHSRISGGELSRHIRELQARDTWTFTFMVPPGNGKAELVRLGIPELNIGTWDGLTERGLTEASHATQVGTQSYVQARAAGQRRVENFYHVTTDLSKVSVTDIRRLQPVTGLSSKQVTKETPVREFVESWTGKPYVIGQAYYQLTKPEVIQPNKGILVAEKGSYATQAYGGPMVRALLGMPTDGSKARVNPGNHANYDIFVQSTSVNRRLVRGTRVLLDPRQGQMSPTWGGV